MNLEYPDFSSPFGTAPQVFTEHSARSRRVPKPRTAEELSRLANADWHYVPVLPRYRVPWKAALVAASVHAVALLAFNGPPKPKFVYVAPAAPSVVLEMVKLEKEEEPIEEPGETPPDPGAFVPTLADLPTSVSLDDAFVQEIDYASLVPRTKIDATGISTIPTTIRYGSAHFGKGMKDLFDLSQLDRIPEAIFQMTPVVPEQLRRAGIGGNVTVRFIVDTAGRVVQPIISSSDNQDFDQLAIETVLKWKFRPGRKEGRPVNTKMQQSIAFRFEGVDP